MARAAAGARRCPQRFLRLCRAVGCAALRSQTCSLPNKATPPPSWQRSDAALPGAAAPGPQPCSSGSTGTATGPSVLRCAVPFRASRGLWPFPERLLQAGSSRSGVRALPSPELALQEFRPGERGQVSLRLLRLLAAPRASVRGSAARQRPSGDGCRLCPGITRLGTPLRRVQTHRSSFAASSPPVPGRGDGTAVPNGTRAGREAGRRVSARLGPHRPRAAAAPAGCAPPGSAPSGSSVPLIKGRLAMTSWASGPRGRALPPG